MNRLKRGFSLIELLIAISVVAVLAAGTMAMIGRGPGQAGRDAKRKADLEKMASGLELYRNEFGYYARCGGGTSCNASSISGLAPTYIDAIPTDGSSGRIYRYYPLPSGCNNTSTRCSQFRICASSEKDTTTNLDGTCGGNCGSASIHCAFLVNNQ